MVPRLRIAAAQFPVSHVMEHNRTHILDLIQEAAEQEADIVHFPEMALPGYLNPVHEHEQVEDALRTVCSAAKKLGMWTILGTCRPTEEELPRNSLLVISEDGQIVGQYDKQRIYKTETKRYLPGNSPLVVTIKGHRCGFLLCYDNCFPELYQQYRTLNIEVLFHSFHNAGNPTETSIKTLMFANTLCRAADHGFYISASNSSTAISPLPAMVARPDGSYVTLNRHETGIVVDTVPCTDLGWTYHQLNRS